ncbi:hypothetical protein GLIP_4207 [Aliiglaciecola lipolytica E3]|uniref:Uncharacterized protein n=1 Tax=Aliiglaciecola lipolytica E3 TaxID=1127673 RepID=K6YJQ5_9ALTE|nr:hypothetical protein GLIP_4207 [Aliiglaciecola lipolytica E3]
MHAKQCDNNKHVDAGAFHVSVIPYRLQTVVVNRSIFVTMVAPNSVN